tara:strand:+ start:7218 stop:7988 length:771 start_codon:yes stop_codon:yes gene_type:complete
MRILQKDKRNAMFALYAFCKKVDTIGDSNQLKTKKIRKIKELKKEINLIFNNKSNNINGKILKKYIDIYNLKKKYFLDIIHGVEMDINNKMICPKKKDFNLYCYRVAGAVGLLSLNIFCDFNKKTKSFALHLAKALQITNILRDIKQDKSMGRMYVPKEILKKSEIKTQNINLIIKNKNFPNACLKLLRIAETNFKNAENDLKKCSKKSLRPAILMMVTYKLLLKKLKKEGWKKLNKKIRLNKIEKIFLFIKGITY